MTEPPQQVGLLRKANLAEVLNVSPRTIDNWIAEKIIPVIAVTPRLYLFDLEEVKAALKRQFEIPATD